MPRQPTKVLPLLAAYEFGKAEGFGAEVNEIKNMQVEWDKNKSTVRRAYIVHLFQTKGIWEKFREQHWPNWETKDGQWRYGRYKKVKAEYEAFIERDTDEDDEEAEAETPDAFAFPLEAQLRDFIAKNLKRLPLAGKVLKLHADERGDGIEYSTDVGFIDILAVDQDGTFHVFELKVGRGPDRALGQLARYMGWVKQKLVTCLNLSGH